MDCNNGCFEGVVECCGDIIIDAGLTASTAYYWILKKIGSNNPVQRQTATDSAGLLTISKAMTPAGFLSGGAQFKLELRKADYLTIQPMVFSTVSYNCAMVTLMNIDEAVGDPAPTNKLTASNLY